MTNLNEVYGTDKISGASVIEVAEHAIINNVAGKKVFNVGEDGNIVKPNLETTQTAIKSLLDDLYLVATYIQQAAQSLQTTDNLQRQRVVVDSITGTSLGQGVATAQTLGPPAAIPVLTTGTNYFQGVYLVGQDWRQTVTDQSNIAYQQMLDRIYIS